MKRKTQRIAARFCALFFILLFFSSCSDGAAGGKYFSLDGTPKLSNPAYQRTAPPLALADTSGIKDTVHQDGNRTGRMDISKAAKGYVAASVVSDENAKFQVKFGELVYNYDLDNTGLVQVFPLVWGDGVYELTIFLHVEGNTYEYFFVQKISVKLENEFLPFLVPNQIVNYNANSSATQLSYTLAKHASNDMEVVQEVYNWVRKNITYDDAKAAIANQLVGYIPDLEQILRDKKGICYDYAALVAAMLRANAIPCKLIKGNVRTGGKDLYHAWNMIWLKDVGWVAVKFPTMPREWERIDLTFAAGNDFFMADFIRNNKNYTNIYVH